MKLSIEKWTAIHNVLLSWFKQTAEDEKQGRLNGVAALRLSRLRKSLDNELSSFYDERKKLAEKLGQVQADGSVKFSSAESAKQFQDELLTLAKDELEISFTKLQPEHFAEKKMAEYECDVLDDLIE